MNRYRVVKITVITCFLLVLVAFVGCLDEPPQLPRIAIDKSVNLEGLIQVDDSEPQDEQMEFSAVFIFKPSCAYCEKNLFFWKKIKSTFKNKIRCYGVILSNDGADASLSISRKINFPLYIPHDPESFKAEFNVEFNLSQTVILKDGHVVFSKSGEILTEDFFKIKNIIKEIKK